MEQVLKLPFSTIIGGLEYRAQASPNKPAVLYPDASKNFTEYASLTFKQYNNVVNHLAEKIHKVLPTSTSAGESMTCGILATGGIEYLLSEYALLKIPNVIMFPISPRNSSAAIEHLVRVTKTICILATRQYVPVLNTIREREEFRSLQVIVLNEGDFVIDELLQRKDEECVTIPREKNAGDLSKVVMILHSSGSTAHPKPIYLTNQYFLISSFAFPSINNDYWKEDDVALTWGALYHLLAFEGTCRSLVVGCTYALPLCVSFPPKPDELVRNIQVSNKINILISVPSLLEVLIRDLSTQKNSHIGLKPLERLRFIMYGGASCPEDICRTLVDHGVILLSVYGSTETNITLGKNFDPYDQRWKTMQIPPVRQPYVRLERAPQSQNPNEKILIHLPTDPFMAKNVSTAPDGSYSAGDILLEDPPHSGQYLVLGRIDDTLVHVNGEKTNPLPMEDIIRRSPLVKQVAIVGHNQFCTGALIQLNLDQAMNCELKEIDDTVWKAVEEANRFAPSHSRLIRSLVKILPMNKVLPVTDKGNLMRRRVIQEYADTITHMFDKFMGQQQANTHDGKKTASTWTKASLTKYLQEKLALTDASRSIFEYGINSLQVVELRNMICEEVGEVPKNFVYEHSSIDKMASALWQLLHADQADETSNDDPGHYKLAEAIVDKYIDRMKQEEEKVTRSKTIVDGHERVFLITGGNGSLGSFVIRDLLRQPASVVRRVYCLLRGANPEQRLFDAFEQRQLDTKVLRSALEGKEPRLVILPSSMDLSDRQLGQSGEVYGELDEKVTDIIHSAWKMNFNQTIKDFEQDSIVGVYHLLALARSNGKQVHFISSVASAGSGVLSTVNEEPLPRRADIALAQGYGQSKYVGEHLCWSAMSVWDVPVSVFRVGQISGDTENGIWNTSEMAAMMIYAGAGRLKRMPDVGNEINWIPVDVCSGALVDLVLKSSFDLSMPADERVYHLLNPHVISYGEYLNELQSAGLDFDVVSGKEFIDIILSTTDIGNPLVKLSSFFEQVLSKKKEVIVSKYATTKTSGRCDVLKNCPMIDGDLIGKYLTYWRKCQVLER